MDIQTLSDEVYRQHALSLLREHASATSIEIWRDEAVVDVVNRTRGSPDGGSGSFALIG